MNPFKLCFYYFFSALSLFFSTTNTQNSSVTNKRRAFIFIFILLLVFFATPFLGQLLTPIAILGICFLLTFHLKDKLLSLICLCLGYLLQVCLDYLYTNLIYFLFHITIARVRAEYFYLFSFLYLPVLYILTKLLGWLLHKKLKIDTFSISPIFLKSIFINLVICVSVFIFGIIYGEKVNYPPNLLLFDGIMFLIYFVSSNATFLIAYRTIKKDLQLKAELEQYENLTAYTCEVERLYLSTRTFKHDYLDILSSMKEYIDRQNLIELHSYFYKNILPLNQEILEADSRLGLLSYLNDDAVKSVVSAKSMVAMEKGIHVELELKEKITFPTIERVDLLRILGIFLNNAIDAALLSIEKEITIAFFKNAQKYTILIRNTTPVLTLPVSVLCDKQTTSKEGHTGIGLETAKSILNKYDNIHWKLSYTAPYFLVEVSIYINETIQGETYD